MYLVELGEHEIQTTTQKVGCYQINVFYKCDFSETSYGH